MSNRNARTLVSAFLVSLAAVGAFSASASAANVPADQYGYSFRTTEAFSDDARSVDAFTDGARKVAGLDRVGEAAASARSADPFLDGARGTVDVFADGAVA